MGRWPPVVDRERPASTARSSPASDQLARRARRALSIDVRTAWQDDRAMSDRRPRVLVVRDGFGARWPARLRRPRWAAWALLPAAQQRVVVTLSAARLRGSIEQRRAHLVEAGRGSAPLASERSRMPIVAFHRAGGHPHVMGVSARERRARRATRFRARSTDRPGRLRGL